MESTTKAINLSKAGTGETISTSNLVSELYSRVSEIDADIEKQALKIEDTIKEFNSIINNVDDEICKIQDYNKKIVEAINVNSQNIETNYENIVNIDKQLTLVTKMLEKNNSFAIKLYDIIKIVLVSLALLTTAGLLPLVYIMHTSHHTVIVVILLAVFAAILYALYMAYSRLCRLISSHRRIAFHYK